MAQKKSFLDNPATRFISIADVQEPVVAEESKPTTRTKRVQQIGSKERTASRVEENARRLEDIRLYSLTELEPILGVTHRTLLTYIKTGKLKGVKLGHAWKVTEENLRRFIDGEG